MGSIIGMLADEHEEAIRQGKPWPPKSDLVPVEDSHTKTKAERDRAVELLRELTRLDADFGTNEFFGETVRDVAKDARAFLTSLDGEKSNG